MTILDLTPTTRAEIMPSDRRIGLAYRREAVPEKPEPPHKAAARRIAQGKGTIYDQEIVAAHRISEFLNERQEALLKGFIKKGKTSRHERNGYFTRRRERRIKHEGWMKQVNNNPNQAHPHPFIT